MQFYETEREKIEKELSNGFCNFFNVTVGLGWFARCAQTGEVVGYRFASDAAYVNWSVEEYVLRGFVRWYVNNSTKSKVAMFIKDIVSRQGLIPSAYFLFLSTPVLLWEQEARFEKAFEADPSYDAFQPGATLNLYGFGVRDDFLGRGIAPQMTVRASFSFFSLWLTG